MYSWLSKSQLSIIGSQSLPILKNRVHRVFPSCIQLVNFNLKFQKFHFAEQVAWVMRHDAEVTFLPENGKLDHFKIILFASSYASGIFCKCIERSIIHTILFIICQVIFHRIGRSFHFDNKLFITFS